MPPKKKIKPATSSGTATRSVGAVAAARACSSKNNCKLPKTKCAICNQDIVDGKDQALLCEGTCKGWFHRYCAGVSIESAWWWCSHVY